MGPYAVTGGIVLLVVVLCAVFAYNRLVRGRNLVDEAWSGIDVQLKRRHDLVPNLVDVVRGYGNHERRLLERVTEARARAARAHDVRDVLAGENSLSDGLKALLAVVEAYPDLKADSTFLALQSELVEIEDHVQMARRYYNGTVREYNIAAQSFPRNLIARAFGFGAREFFELETATDRAVPHVEV